MQFSLTHGTHVISLHFLSCDDSLLDFCRSLIGVAVVDRYIDRYVKWMHILQPLSSDIFKVH